MARKSPSDAYDGSPRRDRELQALQDRVDDLTRLTTRLAEASTMENVLCNGFGNLNDLLAPLRDLTPRYTSLDDDQVAILEDLYEAIARPRWRDVRDDARLALPSPPRPPRPDQERIQA